MLLLVFTAATVEVQTHPFLQRADWRRVALALGPPSVPRVVLAAGGTTAQPLKIYLPGVGWSHPVGAAVRVSEVDVVGATKRIALAPHQPERVNHVPGFPVAVFPAPPAAVGTLTRASTPPRRAAAPARATARGPADQPRKVANWVVSRFALDHPERFSVRELTRTAGRWFLHVPRDLLVFFQAQGG